MLSYWLASGLAILSFGALSVSAYDASRTDNVGSSRLNCAEMFAADIFSRSLRCKPHVREAPFLKSHARCVQLLGPELVRCHTLRRYSELPEEPLVLLPGEPSSGLNLLCITFLTRLV